ncbi:HEAT repeat domain-containing protein [Dyadobacter sp. CY327]|uniref:PVC-type heme-binding CxxCH protein n=1 Tax=Dyadobacter sp. CY327 TaxID=2907301 RepID=UPI001F2E19CC|nr:PVC-type heme-binding CxxCH protein [Dyadobacter sp. CY327]MCE7070124.1 HEAT repeat domain-containing protein [Dyadobacter sp. CY327]
MNPFISKDNRNITRKLVRPAVLALVGIFSFGLTEKSPQEATGLLVPEGFTIESVVSPELLSYPMFASFDGKGRLFVFESTEPNIMGTEKMLAEPSYHIRLLEDVDGDGNFEKNQIFAKNIPFPKGGVFYQGSLYVTESPNLVKYTDTNGDGTSDKREVILTGWVLSSNGATLGGPFFGPDGWMYITDARRGFSITTKEGKALKGKTARIWRCRPDGTGLEAMSGGGFDNSIEIAFMPSGETIGTMTYFVDPQDGQRDALMHWVEGGTYPKPNPAVEADKLKMTGDFMPVMTKMARVAPSGLMRYRGPNFGAKYKGDLFHAEFNTGRVMRHIVSADGATYKTEDEVFMKSTSSDSHPTDVLQDADGSMLVVITGGWFIEGCPLSRVAKPDVKGGIYRIRKTGAAKVSDPWGKKLDLEKQTPATLLKYLSDTRPFVADNAAEQLVLRGNAAVAPILSALPTIKDDKIRAAAIFVLARINTTAAWAGVRNGLNDKSSVVRVASARMIGLAKDVKSVDKLMQLVQKDFPPVRRQAATALGQIGDVRAVPALLNGAADNSDRFVKHAIVHSLITLKTTEPLVKALSNPSPQIRIAALTALDQMDGTPLKKNDLAPVLASKDAELRNTAVWIASHHPEWTDIVVSFLEKSLGDAKLSESDAAAIGDLMLIFMKESSVQNFVAKQLGSPSATADRKLLMLNVISRSSLKELPASWVTEIGKQLRSDDALVRSQILGLIESRRIEAMNPSLNEIIKDEKAPVDFRLKALSARIMSSSKLSDSEFKMLLKYIGKEYDSPLRQLSVRLLNHAELNNEQLLVIAREHIGKTDLFLLPSLMEAFEGNTNEQVGKELIAGIQSGSGRLDNVAEQDFQRLLKSFPPSVHEMAAPLLVKLKAQHAERLAHLQDMEARLKGGDVGEGRKLFYGKASCYLCHSVGSEGGRFGPDLTNIGEIRSKHDILEAVVYPSASFAREYETFRVVTKTSSYTGVIKEQLPEAIIIEVGPVPGLRIPRSEIVSIEPQTLSMMPPGLDQQLTSSEMASLTAFLEALPYRLERMIEARERK